VTAVKDSILRIRVAARDVYLVTGSNKAAEIKVTINGRTVTQDSTDVESGTLKVDMAKLYKLAHFDEFTAGATIELKVPAGVQLNTFTFGG